MSLKRGSQPQKSSIILLLKLSLFFFFPDFSLPGWWREKKERGLRNDHCCREDSGTEDPPGTLLALTDGWGIFTFHVFLLVFFLARY